MILSLTDFAKRFDRARERAQRHVKLVAVSKNQSIPRVEAFLESGLDFWALGESYLEELVRKRKHFEGRQPALLWHFIGRLQSRKIPEILSHSSVLHTVSRIKELEILAPTPRKFFVQVNVSDEDSKNGCRPEELKQLLDQGRSLGLAECCQGLMALPSSLEVVGEAQLRSEIKKLKELRDQHLPAGLLNVGTSNDFEIAIDEGSDLIRVGSLLFGERV